MSRRSGQIELKSCVHLRLLHILWLGWSQIAESTDTWLWQSAPCQVAYPIVPVATTELSESVLLAVSIAPKGILLLLQWHCVRILVSPATCHPVQCRPNMRVSDCKNSWKWNLVKPNLSLFGIPLCKICRTALTLGWSNLMWWQLSECPEDLARSNWEAAFISLMELDILWLGWSQIAESTDTWLWQSAPCQVAYPIVSVATKELSESVLLAVSIAPKGILLLSQWHSVRILYYSHHWQPVIQYNVGQTWGLLTAKTAENGTW